MKLQPIQPQLDDLEIGIFLADSSLAKRGAIRGCWSICPLPDFNKWLGRLMVATSNPLPTLGIYDSQGLPQGIEQVKNLEEIHGLMGTVHAVGLHAVEAFRGGLGRLPRSTEDYRSHFLQVFDPGRSRQVSPRSSKGQAYVQIIGRDGRVYIFIKQGR